MDYLKPLNNIVFTALNKCLYPLHIHCTENLKFVTLTFSWRQINSWSQPNWQLTNEKWFFFCAGTVLCALFRSVLRNVRVAGTRVSTHCRTVRRQNWTGKWPKTSIIANFSVRKSCVFIFGSLCCSLSPKTRVSDFQFFPDSEEDKSEYVDVQRAMILRTKKNSKKKMAAVGTLLFQQRIPQCLLIMSSTG